MTFKLRKLKLVIICAAVLMLAGTLTAFAENKLGDADSDGYVTINDVTFIQKYIAELPVGDGFSKTAADIDGNGAINISDATLIQKWLAEIETPYPIGEQPTEPQTEPATQSPTDDEGWGHYIFRP